VLVRKDLPPSQIAVQACHASIEVARDSLIPSGIDHPSVIVCGVDNEAKLRSSLAYVQEKGIPCRLFHEPDRNNEATAFATAPVYGDDRKLFKKFQLIKASDFVEPDAFSKYALLLVQLHLLIVKGLGDSDEADVIRDQMDQPWQHLRLPEMNALWKLSADLYTLSGRKEGAA
jgi:hypothetical protein